MSTPQIEALLTELLNQTRRNQALLEQIASQLGDPGQPNPPGGPESALVKADSPGMWRQPARPTDRFGADPGITDEVARHVAQGNMIQAIKAYKDQTGASLAGAKRAVEDYRDRRW